MTQITIIDRQTDKVLDDIQMDEFWDELRTRDLNGLDIFDFVTFADKVFSQYLKGEKGLIIPAREGGYAEFIIKENKQTRDRNRYIFSEGSFIEIAKKKIIEPGTYTGTPQQLIQLTMNGIAKWKIGNVAYATIRTIQVEERITAYQMLKRIASAFEYELKFRIENTNGMILRYIDLVEKIGAYRGHEIELGHNLESIERHENTRDIVTALNVYGPPDENGNRKHVFVFDNEALDRWSTDGEHLVEDYYPETMDQDITVERLTTLGENELEKRVKALVTYTAKMVDLGEDFHFGDEVRVKDEKFNPPLYLEGRIHTLREDLKGIVPADVDFGAFLELSVEDAFANFRKLQEEMAKKIKEAIIPELTSAPDPNEYPKYINISVSPPQFTIYDWDINEWTTVKGEKGDRGDDGEQGPKGPKGDKGDTGVGIDSIVEYYLATNSSSGVTTSTSGWSTTVQTITNSKRYLWNYEKIIYTDGTVENTTPVIIGVYGDTGDTGAPGKSIDTITEYYLATNLSSGVTRSTSGWTTTVQTVTSSKKYLWNYEKITYKNPTSTEYVEPVIIGVYGDKGDKGDPGSPGKDGIAHIGTSPPSNPAINATWFETNTSGRVIAIKRWTGSQWVAATMTQDVLNVTNLSAISANLGEVTAGKLTGVEIIGGTIKSNTTIDVTTDLNVGNNIYLGKDALLGRKTIDFFQGNSYIASEYVNIGGINRNRLSIVAAGTSGIVAIAGNEIQLTGTNIVSFVGQSSTASIDISGGIARWRQSPSNYIRQDLDGTIFFYQGGAANYSFSPGGEMMFPGTLLRTSQNTLNIGVESWARVTDKNGFRSGGGTVYKPIYAAEFNTSSLAQHKQDIEEWDDRALDIVVNGTIYRYALKDSPSHTKYGFVIGEGYNTPKEVIAANGEAIDHYKAIGILFKAVQELASKVEQLEGR